MKAALSVLFLSWFLAAPLIADHDCESDLSALRALYELRYVVLHPDFSSYAVGTSVDRSIDEMRGPLPGGGFRWVRYVRPAGSAPEAKREHVVGSEHGEETETFEASADHAFAVRVVVPRKRSLFKANKQAWLGTLTVNYEVAGEPRTLGKEINQFFKPDTSKTFDLGGISDKADASLEVAANDADEKESVVEIHFKLAVPEDDPDNPNYEAIRLIRRLRSDPDPANIDVEVARLERRLFPALEPLPLTTLFGRLREAELLMRSEKIEEQETGRQMLSDLVRTLPR